ncbi:nucleoid-associated protein [Dethiothermospora halolimnae]|uniref:nucleoid-associated protein n=1 Tax=Dethiothermospora halolimnae TaxID=3114390 RepID=UPI003CCB7781
MDTGEITVRRAIVHILDSTIEMPVLSDLETPLNNDLKEFLSKHILKVFKDDSVKKVYFNDENNRIKNNTDKLKEGEEDFIRITKDIAYEVHKLIKENPTIPSADLVCVYFKKENSMYFGALKFNYKDSYIHFIEEGNLGRTNTIIKQKTALPTAGQKIDECFLINLTEDFILLKEKKFDIEGVKQFYLSNTLLNTTDVLSDKEKINIINKASKNVVKKYYDGDVKKMAEIKSAIEEEFDNEGSIDIQKVTNRAFKDNLEIQKAYSEEVEKRGLTDKEVNVSENVEKKVRKRQRLVTDDGIEIKLPAAYLTRDDKVEFLSNPDGTVSIVLKNINSIEDK